MKFFRFKYFQFFFSFLKKRSRWGSLLLGSMNKEIFKSLSAIERRPKHSRSFSRLFGPRAFVQLLEEVGTSCQV